MNQRPKRKQFQTRSQYVQAWTKWKKETDPKYDLLLRIYAATSNMMRKPTKHIKKYLNCNWPTFKAHIESQFTDGMTWENYGEYWECDHRVSLIQAYKDNGLDGMLAAANYINVRPCLVSKNRKKRTKHTTRDRFCAYDHVTEVHDDHFIYTFQPNTYTDNSRYKFLILDKELLSLFAERGTYLNRAKWPTLWSNSKGEGASLITYLLGVPAKHVRRIEGEPNDFRKECFEIISKREFAERQRNRWKIQDKRRRDKDPEKYYSTRRKGNALKSARLKLNAKLKKEFKEKSNVSNQDATMGRTS